MPDEDPPALDGTEDALAGRGVEVSHLRQPRGIGQVGLGLSTMARASGCSEAVLDRGREPQQLPFGEVAVVVGELDGDDGRLALGEGAGLVDDDGVDLLHPLERFGVLDEDAHLGSAADADHDRHRCGQAEGTRAGDDEDADGDDERVRQLRVGADEGPDEEREHGDADDGGHEHGGDAVDSALDGCAGALGFGDHLHDAGQHGVAAHRVGAHRRACRSGSGCRR